MPRVCAARLELHHLGDPDAALDTVEGAFELIDDEADLIEALWDSLDDKDVPVTEPQRAELDRRIAGFERDRNKAFRGISLVPNSDSGAEGAVSCLRRR